MADTATYSASDVEIAPNYNASDVEIAPPARAQAAPVESTKLPPEVLRAISSVPYHPPAMSPAPLLERQPGTNYQAAPAQESPEVRLGKMVPEAAVPALDVANRYAVQPFQRAAQWGGEQGKQAVRGTFVQNLQTPNSDEAARLNATGDFAAYGREAETRAEREHPLVSGVLEGAGEFAGQTAADPRNWPFMASGAARPMLQRLMARGFAAGMTAQTVTAAKELHDNWDNLTPQQRAELGTQTGLGALMAVEVTRPRLGIARSPEGSAASATILGGEAGAGVAVTPEGVTVRGKVGPLEGSKTFARKAKPAEAPTLTPQTIEGELAKNPATRDEISEAQVATNYVHPDAAKAAVVAKRVAEGRAATISAVPPGGPEKPAGVEKIPAVTPTKTTPPKPAVQTPAKAAPVELQSHEVEIQPSVIGKPTAKPRTNGEPLEHGFDFRPAEDVGTAVREDTQKTNGALPRDERRKVERTPEEQQTQTLFKQARTELGEDASSDQVMARVDELKKASPQPEFQRSEVEVSLPKEQQYKHRSTQVNIPEDSEAHSALDSARQRIADSDLAGDGKDIGGNHVTVRWGLTAPDDDKLEKLKSYISSLTPFEATLGKTEKFKPSESSDGAAVIQAPIEAPELGKINSELEKHAPFTEPTFKSYTPHATIAYVNPEKADRYVGMAVTHGKKFTVNSIAILDRNGNHEEVRLKGKKSGSSGPVSSNGHTWEYKGGLFRKDGKVLDKSDEIADAVAALSQEDYFGGKTMEGEIVRGQVSPARIAAPEKTEPVGAATPERIEAGRDKILESEIKHLTEQATELSKQVTAKGYYHPDAKPLAEKHNQIAKQVREKTDELARLRGEPTRDEKRDLQQKEVEKPFAERPKASLSYGDNKQSQHWQVLEPDYIEKRFKDKVRTYERAITESEQERDAAKPGTKKRSDALMNLEFRKKALERFKAKDPREAQSFKNEYNDLVKKAVSQGKPVPDAVIAQKSEFLTAKDARERYEKGRHTSFANKSAAINDTMQKEEGFKVKRQDGKPITDDQIKEISSGVDDVVKVLGEPLRDMMRGTDLTIAHTSGKHPFLSDAGGMYHSVDRTITAGIADFLGRPVKALAHELGHWFDFESGRAIGVKSRIYTKGGKGHETQYLSESDSSRQLYELARRSMTDTREVSRMLKITKLSDLPETERAEVERVKVVLGPYWKDPRELFARMFEQYVADELGKSSTAAEDIAKYHKAPAWWSTEAWAKLKPMMAQEIAKRFDALKERYAPKEVAPPAMPKFTPSADKSNPEFGQARRELYPNKTDLTDAEVTKVINRAAEIEKVRQGHLDWAAGRAYWNGKDGFRLYGETRGWDGKNGRVAPWSDAVKKQYGAYSDKFPEDARKLYPTREAAQAELRNQSGVDVTQWKQGGEYRSGPGPQPQTESGAIEPVAGVEKITPAEQQFEKDVKKRAAALRQEIAQLRAQTSAPAAYYQDSAKNAAAREERSRSVARLSEAQHELEQIERANPHQVTPLNPDNLPDREKNKYAFQREYFTQSLQPVLDAWKAQLGPKFLNAVKNGTKGVGNPPEFPERQVLVDIPGDGHFRVNNEPGVLEKVIRGAAKGFANPGVGRGLKPTPQRVSREPSEPAKWSYLERMADEATDAPTQEEKDAALETIENILGKTPLKTLPKPGTTVEYRGEAYFVNGWDSDYRKTVNLVPVDSEAGKYVGKWLKEGSPKLGQAETAAMQDRVRDAQESASLYLLQHVTEPPEATARPGPAKEPTTTDAITGESGSFDPSKLAEAATELYKQDVAPALDKAGIGLKGTAGLFVGALYPRIEESSFLGRKLGLAAPSEAVDALMKLKGERARALAEFDGIMRGMEKMFDRLPDAERVNFIDRLQTGQKQPTGTLQEIADAIQKIQAEQRSQEQEAANLGRPASQRVNLPEKQNYFHNRWDTPPGHGKAEDEEARIGKLFTPRRPLEGSKSYNKQQSYTLKSGIEAGGKPVTTNPVRLLRLRLEDGMKFVTARRAWNELGELKLREFVPKGERLPEGFDAVDDRIARVYFPVETASGKLPVEGGQWAVEANTARLLNNMLSRDLIRGNPVGRGLMWLKNASTALELGLSPFHAVFETIEAASSQLALGALRSYNLGLRGADAHEFMTGLKQILEAPVAPITMAREGASLPAYVEARARLEKIGITEFGHNQVEGKQPHGVLESLAHFREVRKQAGIQRLLKRYPDLDQLLDDMFTGGLVIGQHQDYQVKMLGKTAAEAWSAGNPIGATVRAIPTVMQGVMKPLFQWYIPNLKYSLFLRQMSEQAAEHSVDLESGAISRAELARKVADSVENRFGELNFDNLFWNRTLKTAMQFAFRSVTWKLGNVRELGGAVAGQSKELVRWAWQTHQRLDGAPTDPLVGEDIPSPEAEASQPGALPKLDAKASWLMSLMVTTVGLGVILSKLLTHKYPWQWADEEHKDDGSAERARGIYLETIHPRTGEIDSRGKPVRVSLPTYWKDVEHAASSPEQYIVGSLSSTLGKGIDLAHNEDYFGNYVYNPNAPLGTKLQQAGKYAFPTPFAVSNFERSKQAAGKTTAWLSAFGFPKAPSDLDFTPAERLARDLLKAREPRHTPEEMEEWQQKRERFERGEMSGAEAHRYLQHQRGTWLQREVKQLTYGEAMQVIEKANSDERSSLHHVIAEKRSNVLKRGGYQKIEEAEKVVP